MAGRNVVWSKASVDQRRAVLRFWTIHNGSNTFSVKLIRMVKSRMTLISKFPFLGTQTEIEGIRVAIVSHYSVFYKVSENEIGVVAFWDNRQDPDKISKLLTLNS